MIVNDNNGRTLIIGGVKYVDMAAEALDAWYSVATEVIDTCGLDTLTLTKRHLA